MSASPWLGGQRVTAERLAEMLPKYSNWTPVWSTNTGAHIPTYGNASIDCRYAINGDLVIARYYIAFGSTTNFNSGTAGDNFIFSLPVAAADTAFCAGSGWVQQDTFKRCPGTPRLYDTSNFWIETTAGFVDGTGPASTGLMDAVTPFTWASGNTITGVLQYEKA